MFPVLKKGRLKTDIQFSDDLYYIVKSTGNLDKVTVAQNNR
ncbi:hypothetical protein HMPREF3156_01527 [Neisseria sp. HMSC06F02]|nr:hypothetical protein HMPREF3156_01527 [Neisseria sp. HMSC06F02]